MAKTDRPSFIKGMGRSILQNCPLLLGGILLLILGLTLGNRVLRIIAYSLFIAYVLSCSFQTVYSFSSRGMARAEEKAAKRIAAKTDSGARQPPEEVDDDKKDGA